VRKPRAATVAKIEIAAANEDETTVLNLSRVSSSWKNLGAEDR
jgi:hypothetical protein